MAYQQRPPPQRVPQQQYSHRQPPPRDGRQNHGLGEYRDPRAQGHGYSDRDGYQRNAQDPYNSRGNRDHYPPRGPPDRYGYNANGSMNPQRPPPQDRTYNKPVNRPPPLRQYPNQAPVRNPHPAEAGAPSPSFQTRNRSNSIDLNVERQMGALDIGQSSNHGIPPVVRPHTSNTNRPRPSHQNTEQLPPMPRMPPNIPLPSIPPHHGNGQQDVDANFTAPPPMRSATMPLNVTPALSSPQYPGKATWQEPPLSPARPGTATGLKPEPLKLKPTQDLGERGTPNDKRDTTVDFINRYLESDSEMPNFDAMSNNTAGNAQDESLLPLNMAEGSGTSQSGPKPAYTAYQPQAGIDQPQTDQEGYGYNAYDLNNDFRNGPSVPTSPGYMDESYGYDGGETYSRKPDIRGMPPPGRGQRGGYGGRGAYPPGPQPNAYGPPPHANGRNRQPHDMQGGMHNDNQFSGPQSPDALPHHPAPFRPGLEQGPRSAPVRQYTNAAPTPAPPRQATPAKGNGPREPDIITPHELQRIKQAAQINPSDSGAQLLYAKKLVEASIHLVEDGSSDMRTKAKNRERYIFDAHKIIKKLVSSGYPEAMFYLADCYGEGRLGLEVNTKEAFGLYQSAAKMGHADSAYRVAVCCEMGQDAGGGTRRDPLKAVQWYKRAAALGDTPAMYKMGMILLKGLLGQQRNPREALSWLKRAAERADEENPHALHELALLYDNPGGNDSVIRDENYAQELLHQAAELGYKFSQHRLGHAYEYGHFACPVDARQSIVWYTRAAAQGEHQSELSLSGWYLTGAGGILQQSDTEAYLWARKAAVAGLAKAEYAMGYFTEVGIGVSANMDDAKRWYWKASSQNFMKARERLEELRRGGAKMQKTRLSRSAVNKQTEGDCVVM